MLIRTDIPKFYSPEFKSFNLPRTTELSSGIHVSSFNSGDQEVFKIELIFPIGTSVSSNPAIPSLCLDMLREGSRTKSASEINNILDYYGAFINFNAGLDNTIITLFGRSVFIKFLIPLLAEILATPVFDELALNKHKLRMTQKLLINEKKTSYWAPRLLRRSIFGEAHQYSRLLSSAAINEITRDDLVAYHQNYLSGSLHNIIVAGAYDDKKFTQLLHDNFLQFASDYTIGDLARPNPVSVRTETKEIGDASQASLAIGKECISNTHTEYAEYTFVTKVLGGYFGSRLMKKLREEEGLTYGIHAFNNHLRGGSYLQISADVELNSVDKSIELILTEIDNLKELDISLHEINTVKNYMIGEFVNESNTVFDFAELYKKLILQNLPEDHYQVFYNKVSKIEPEAIKSIASERLVVPALSLIKVY